jgi:tripartite-type tricarboxylate transporter receptor subunit TctC
MKGRTGNFLFVGLCLLLGLAASAQGQDFPSRPIEYIVGYPPGGVQDPQARGLCKAAEKYLGQPLVVVNKPGVSGALAMTHLASQKNDGYTLGQLAASVFNFVPFFEKVTYKPEDFSYIMGFGFHLHGLSVKADAPWNTFRDFLDYAKKNPGKVKYASYSPVSVTTIVMDLIAKEEGIDWTHIPYKGDGPSITALLGKHVDAVATAAGQVPYLRSGQLKLLAIFNSHEFKEFPNVPTLKAMGYKFPMLSNMTTYTGIAAPKGLRPEILKKLEEAFIKAAKDPSFLNVMDSLSAPVILKDAAEFKAEVLNSYQICEKLIPPMAAKLQR